MTPQIPFFSFKKMNTDVRQELVAGFESFIDSERYVLGDSVKQFESGFASYCGAKHCCGVANGLDALVIALKTLEIGPGDEVIVPSNTYIASWLAVSQVGAIPVPVEPRIDTYNLNPELIIEKISRKTRAIMPVHLYGQCCEMEAIMKTASDLKLDVIEDNAQAQGASFNGHITGSFGKLNATSFYPAKNIGAYGDAGAITTNDESLLQKVSVLRNYGSRIKYYNEVKGFNSRLDEIQAAFLSVKLPYLNNWNNERQAIARAYTEQLKGTGDLVLPVIAQGATSVYHQYVIRTSKRDKLQAHLLAKGIGTLVHYPVPPHLQKAYTDLNLSKGSLPLAEEIADTCLSLPIYPGLTEADIAYIAGSIKTFYHG